MDEDKLWEDIIPDKDRIKLAEEEVQALGDRKAKLKAAQGGNQASSEEEAEDGDDENDSEGKENKEHVLWRTLNMTQTRNFLKACKRLVNDKYFLQENTKNRLKL